VRRALALEAVVEGELRAKVIGAEAEFQASARLAEAADVLKVPAAYLRWLTDAGANRPRRGGGRGAGPERDRVAQACRQIRGPEGRGRARRRAPAGAKRFMDGRGHRLRATLA
jgi:hypothetical protein